MRAKPYNCLLISITISLNTLFPVVSSYIVVGKAQDLEFVNGPEQELESLASHPDCSPAI